MVIMTESVMERLNFKRKLMLSAGELLAVARRLSFGSDPQRKAGLSLGWDFVPDGFTAKNVTLRMPIQRAYGVEDYQISSGVKWLSSDAYNIEAKVDASVAERLRKVTREQRRIEQQPRLQRLLAERRKLEL